MMKITKMSDQLWLENAYDKNEVDRVVLVVSLKASDGEKTNGIKHTFLTHRGLCFYGHGQTRFFTGFIRC